MDPTLLEFEALVADVVDSSLEEPAPARQISTPRQTISRQLLPLRGHDSKASTRPPSSAQAAQGPCDESSSKPGGSRVATLPCAAVHQKNSLWNASSAQRRKKSGSALPYLGGSTPGGKRGASAYDVGYVQHRDGNTIFAGTRRASTGSSSGSNSGLKACSGPLSGPQTANKAQEEKGLPKGSGINQAGGVTMIPEWQAQFFKTKMCPYIENGGTCCTSGSCRFAHSLKELRPLPDLRKTKLCSSYTKRVTCRNPECPFAHHPDELRTSSSIFYKVTLCNFYKNSKCWNGPNCRFAHGVQELRQSGPSSHPFKGKRGGHDNWPNKQTDNGMQSKLEDAVPESTNTRSSTRNGDDIGLDKLVQWLQSNEANEPIGILSQKDSTFLRSILFGCD